MKFLSDWPFLRELFLFTVADYVWWAKKGKVCLLFNYVILNIEALLQCYCYIWYVCSSGKSTLVSALLNEIRDEEKEDYFDGINIHKCLANSVSIQMEGLTLEF